MIKELFNCEHVGRMTGDDRRKQILETAVRLFSAHGFSGTTTRKIAEAAGNLDAAAQSFQDVITANPKTAAAAEAAAHLQDIRK